MMISVVGVFIKPFPRCPEPELRASVLSVLVGGLNDLEEFFRVQGGGADETAIHILLVEKGFRIGLVHGAAVLNGGGPGDPGAIEFAQHAPDGGADLSGLLGRGGVACADGPNGLIGNDHPAHGLRADPGQGGLQLVGDELQGDTQLPLRQVFPHAENGPQARARAA